MTEVQTAGPIILDEAEAEAFRAYQAQQAEQVRQETEQWERVVRNWAQEANGYGQITYSDLNPILVQVGVEPFIVRPGSDHEVRYQVTVHNHLRLHGSDEAALLAEVGRYLAHNNDGSGSMGSSYRSSGHNVDPDSVQLEWRRTDDSWVPTAEYFAERDQDGKSEAEVPATLAEKKALLRTLAVEFYRKHAASFCLDGPRRAFRDMGIGEVPERVTRSVRVPVTQATVEIDVAVYEGDDDATVLAAAEQEMVALRRRREIGRAVRGTEITFGELTVVPAQS